MLISNEQSHLSAFVFSKVTESTHHPLPPSNMGTEASGSKLFPLFLGFSDGRSSRALFPDLWTRWKAETGLGFGLYGTPAESLCYRFARIDKERFGTIKDVTDKGYYTSICGICQGQNEKNGQGNCWSVKHRLHLGIWRTVKGRVEICEANTTRPWQW